jgi:uroporphyrinogen-III decarboxylase
VLGDFEAVLGGHAVLNRFQFGRKELNDLAAIKRAGEGKLSFMGGISSSLLINGNEQSVIQQVADTISLFSSDGGYVVGAGSEINSDVPNKNFFSILRALSATKD